MCLLGEIGEREPQDVLRSRAPLDLNCGAREAGLRDEGSLQGDALEMVTTGAEVALSFGEREPVGSLPSQTCIRNLRVGKHLHTQAEAKLSPLLQFRAQVVARQTDKGLRVTREGHR